MFHTLFKYKHLSELLKNFIENKNNGMSVALLTLQVYFTIFVF